MRQEKHADGLWHVVAAPETTLCGRPREPQSAGRPGRTTCERCAALTPAAAVVEVETRRLEPVARADGRCARCGKDRQPERSRSYGGIEAEGDPFCSTACCRRWYGLPVTTKDIAEAAA